MKRILITGANGFVGSHVVNYFADLVDDYEVIAAVRTLPLNTESPLLSPKLSPKLTLMAVGNLTDQTQWEQVLQDVDVVIHCAAIATALNSDSLAEQNNDFTMVNTLATLHLARQAVEANVSQFVFMSSIKAETADDAYGKSKQAAEKGLQAIDTDMVVSILRPSIVYGSGVKGNIASLTKVLKKNIPLPFGAITKNKRSFLSIDNLKSFIKHIIEHPLIGTFNVSDGQTISTTDLLKAMREGTSSKSILLPVPTSVFKFAGRLLNKQDVISRLVGDAEVDISHTLKNTDWKPTGNTAELITQYLKSER